MLVFLVSAPIVISPHKLLNQIQRSRLHSTLLQMVCQQIRSPAFWMIDQNLLRGYVLDHLHKASEIEMIAQLDSGIRCVFSAR